IADAIWYPIWDAGLQLDHSVRTLRQTKEVVLGDVKSALSLLNGRVIAGDGRLGTAVLEQARELWKHKPRASLARLRESLEERWSQHGELAFLLEP
ncbi:MAG: [protein-PII] uridylyltransferase, partial [Actinomycetota bacterium]|nr:[protein-PII] uridylyltransferase [Actinomycetota bacterium]